MSISKGAFGQSAKGSFIESRLGARGWGGKGLVVLITDGASSRGIYEIDPADGSVVWTGSLTGQPNLIAFNRAFKLFARRTNILDEYSRTDGSNLNSLTIGNGGGLAAVGNDLVASYVASGSKVGRFLPTLDADEVWEYAAPLNGTTNNVVTDSSGRSYWIRQLATSANFGAEIHRFALSSSGSLLWSHDQTTPVDDPTVSTTGISESYRDNLYVYVDDTTGGNSTAYIRRISKSDGTFVDGVGTGFLLGGTNGGLVHLRTIRAANDDLYVPVAWSAGYTKSLLRITTDLGTEVASFNSGAGGTSVDYLPPDEIGEGDVVLTGAVSSTWPGAGGASANVWRLSADLSTVRWGVLLNTSSYSGLQVISSYKPN